MAPKWLLVLVEVNEKDFSPGDTYTTLPDRLDATLSTVLPGLDVEKMYLLDRKQKKLLEQIADDTALDYHHYAVSVRGEKCLEKNCEQHPVQNVLNFYDHSQRHRTPPGVN